MLLCAAFGLLLLVAGVVCIIKIIKMPVRRKLSCEVDSYKTLAGELKETNKEMKEELFVLQEKVSSIEKMLKEVG